jgi:hypothetical protein
MPQNAEMPHRMGFVRKKMDIDAFPLWEIEDLNFMFAQGNTTIAAHHTGYP